MITLGCKEAFRSLSACVTAKPGRVNQLQTNSADIRQERIVEEPLDPLHSQFRGKMEGKYLKNDEHFNVGSANINHV